MLIWKKRVSYVAAFIHRFVYFWESDFLSPNDSLDYASRIPRPKTKIVVCLTVFLKIELSATRLQPLTTKTKTKRGNEWIFAFICKRSQMWKKYGNKNMEGRLIIPNAQLIDWEPAGLFLEEQTVYCINLSLSDGIVLLLQPGRQHRWGR